MSPHDHLLELNHQRYAEEVAVGLRDEEVITQAGAKRSCKPKAAEAESATLTQMEPL